MEIKKSDSTTVQTAAEPDIFVPVNFYRTAIFENIMVITNGLNELGSAIEVVNETYYDIDGKQLTAPLQGKTIIAVRKYSNGTTRVTKEIAK